MTLPLTRRDPYRRRTPHIHRPQIHENPKGSCVQWRSSSFSRPGLFKRKMTVQGRSQGKGYAPAGIKSSGPHTSPQISRGHFRRRAHLPMLRAGTARTGVPRRPTGLPVLHLGLRGVQQQLPARRRGVRARPAPLPRGGGSVSAPVLTLTLGRCAGRPRRCVRWKPAPPGTLDPPDRRPVGVVGAELARMLVAAARAPAVRPVGGGLRGRHRPLRQVWVPAQPGPAVAGGDGTAARFSRRRPDGSGGSGMTAAGAVRVDWRCAGSRR